MKSVGSSSQEKLPSLPSETFVIDGDTGTVIFPDGFKLAYKHPQEILGASLEPEFVIRAAIRHIGTEKAKSFWLMNIEFRHGGISDTILLAKIHPAVIEPTWQVHFHLLLPGGVLAFPGVYPVFVRDSDGVAWTWERHPKRSGLVPSYMKQATQWDDKPQSQRKKKTKTT